MFSVSLTNPTLFSLSLSLSLCCLLSNSLKNQICVQWAWVRRFKNQLLDWCQTSCGQLALLFFCLCPASALLHIISISLSLSLLSSISAALTRRKTTCFFFFVTLRCIDCLTCQCAVQFKPSFSCIAGRSKNIDLWRPTEALYCVFFVFFLYPLTVWDH